MYFVGLDLAWGEKNQTGVAAIDSDGRLVHVGAAQDDASIEAAIGPVRRRRLPGRHRRAADRQQPDRATGRARRPSTGISNGSKRAHVRQTPTSRNSRIPAPRESRPRSASTWTPHRAATARAIEVYPHPATIVLFGLEKTLKYKRGAFEDRQRELLRLMTLIEGLDKATPRLAGQPQRGVGRTAQEGGGRDPPEPTRPGRGSRRRRAVRVRRAVLVSPARRRDHLRRLRHAATSSRRRSPAKWRRSPMPPNDVNERLTRLAALLQQAQLELTEIRRRLG